MRADVFLFRAGYAKSREAARKSIEQGLVRIDGQTVSKPAQDIDVSYPRQVVFQETCPFVGRGGMKLSYALKMFAIDPEDLICMDIGASTGGFTDCLLEAGAQKVYSVDSGHGQLDPKLTSDERVVNLEGVNARSLSENEIPELCDLAVMDVSFISQTLILPAIASRLKDDGILISLIKPQFEAGRTAVGKGGIVKKAADRARSAQNVQISAEHCGLYMQKLIRSPITGGDGNHEYLALFGKEKMVFAIDRNLFE